MIFDMPEDMLQAILTVTRDPARIAFALASHRSLASARLLQGAAVDHRALLPAGL